MSANIPPYTEDLSTKTERLSTGKNDGSARKERGQNVPPRPHNQFTVGDFYEAFPGYQALISFADGRAWRVDGSHGPIIGVHAASLDVMTDLEIGQAVRALVATAWQASACTIAAHIVCTTARTQEDFDEFARHRDVLRQCVGAHEVIDAALAKLAQGFKPPRVRKPRVKQVGGAS